MCRHTPTVATTQWDPKSLSPAVVRVVWLTMALSVTFLHPLVPRGGGSGQAAKQGVAAHLDATHYFYTAN